MQTDNKNRFTVIHRTLHWSIALLMFILFITGFLRMNWMSKKTIINAVETTTQRQHISIGKEQLTHIAKSIQAPMWEWHEYAAYIMLFAFSARIIYMIIKGIKFPHPFVKKQSGKDRVQGLSYLVFYLFVGISIITGFFLKWGSETFKEPMETVHKWAIYWFPAFILLHFAGIVIGELTGKKGIVSKMIGGNK